MEVGLLRRRLPLRAGSRTHVHARTRFKVRRATWTAGVGVGFFRPSRRLHRRRRVSSYVGLPAVAVASRGRAVYMNGVNYDGVGRLEPRLTFWRSCYAG